MFLGRYNLYVPARNGAMSKPKAKKKGYLILYALAFLLAASAFAVWAWVGSMDSRASGVQPSPAAEDAAESAAQYDAEGFAMVDWDSWRQINPDVVGWVNVPGTGISQPICKAGADAPDYWNSHDVYGEYNLMGCPFLDADCTGGLEGSANAVVQGHNVSGAGSGMFADFSEFADEGFANEHAKVLLQTPTAKMELAAFAVEVVPNAGSDDSLRTSFDSDADFQRYVAERVAASAVRIGGAPSSQMWTFSTCSYLLTPENERTVVHCKLVRKSSVG